MPFRYEGNHETRSYLGILWRPMFGCRSALPLLRVEASLYQRSWRFMIFLRFPALVTDLAEYRNTRFLPYSFVLPSKTDIIPKRAAHDSHGAGSPANIAGDQETVSVSTLFFHSREPFDLRCGDRLEEFTLAYETYGTLNADRSNAVLVFHA